MNAITRRNALVSAGAAAVAASVPGAVRAGKSPLGDTKTREVLELFGQLNLTRQEISLMAMRMFLKVQRGHERQGLTEEAAQSLQCAAWEAEPWPQ